MLWRLRIRVWDLEWKLGRRRDIVAQKGVVGCRRKKGKKFEGRLGGMCVLVKDGISFGDRKAFQSQLL